LDNRRERRESRDEEKGERGRELKMGGQEKKRRNKIKKKTR